MDIHKPKPWHGLREFLKEYLIIVVAALGAEAVVQSLHERRLSAEAREAVRAEIALDLANFQRRAQWQPCIDRRLSELSDFLSKADRGEPIRPVEIIGNPGAPLLQTQRWDAATAGGRTSLLGLDEQHDFARIYASLASVMRHELAEDEAWSDLMALEGVERPAPELLARAQTALGRARWENWALRGNLREAVEFAGYIGVRPTPNKLAVGGVAPPAADHELLCMPIWMPHAEAAKRVRDPLGSY